MRKPVVVFSLIGSMKDSATGPARWETWRPTVSLCAHEDLLVDRIELLYECRFKALVDQVSADIAAVSPETEIRTREIEFADPWDLEEVYAKLLDLAEGYPFDPEEEEYLVNITTGTHVWQICLFLLTEARRIPARLIQASPPRGRGQERAVGSYRVIDLDLSRYDRLAARFHREQGESLTFLKSGIETRNVEFNQLIERIEQVAGVSSDPILLMGPTGAGKSQLARRIFELKQLKRQVKGGLVEVTCSTLRGDSAMSALFGHVRGAFTGATSDRAGYLRTANQGALFLDEIGELGLEEQAMLLRCLEEHLFFPVGSDKEVRSEFQLIAGTNRNLTVEVQAGRFREDLLARINLWTFRLPGLASRHEDIEPNLDYELEKFAARTGTRVSFNKEARAEYLGFAVSAEAIWSANFRDLGSSITRMATLASGGRISAQIAREEIERLRRSWSAGATIGLADQILLEVLGGERLQSVDEFDRAQLASVISVCRASKNLSVAGRRLFQVSRLRRQSVNDSDRLRKYLARFGLDWDAMQQS